MAFNIVVCAKQVPDTNEIRINPETGTLIRDGVPSILNPDDANALEEALKIKDTDPENVHVTVVSMDLRRLRTCCSNAWRWALMKAF
jgi:electron transfer flavoprotein beta subunit